MAGLINEVLQWVLLFALLRQQAFFTDWQRELRSYLIGEHEDIRKGISDIPDPREEIGGLHGSIFDLEKHLAKLHGEVLALRADLVAIQGQQDGPSIP